MIVNRWQMEDIGRYVMAQQMHSTARNHARAAIDFPRVLYFTLRTILTVCTISQYRMR